MSLEGVRDQGAQLLHVPRRLIFISATLSRNRRSRRCVAVARHTCCCARACCCKSTSGAAAAIDVARAATTAAPTTEPSAMSAFPTRTACARWWRPDQHFWERERQGMLAAESKIFSTDRDISTP